MKPEEQAYWECQRWQEYKDDCEHEHEQEHQDRGETLVRSLNRFEIAVAALPYDDPDGYEFERASGFGGLTLEVEYRCTSCGRNILYRRGQ